MKGLNKNSFFKGTHYIVLPIVFTAAHRFFVKLLRGMSRVIGTTATVDKLETMCFFASGGPEGH